MFGLLNNEQELAAYKRRMAELQAQRAQPQQGPGAAQQIWGAVQGLLGQGGDLNPTGGLVEPSMQGLGQASEFAREMVDPNIGAEHMMRALGEGRYVDAASEGIAMLPQVAPAVGMFGKRFLREGAEEMAERMAREGASPEDIWRATGAMRSPGSNQWVGELSDDLAQAGPSRTAPIGERTPAKQFSDYVSHPALFEAYPEVAAAKTARTRDVQNGAVRGAFDPKAKTIEISGGQELERHISTGLHEAQHFLDNLEGRPGGTNPWNAGGYDQYRRNPSELQAYNVESRMRMTPEERAASYPPTTSEVPYTDMGPVTGGVAQARRRPGVGHNGGPEWDGGPGLPPGVNSAEDEAALIGRYVQKMAEGAPYRNWYAEAGGSTRRHMGGDPQRMMRMTAAQGVTSANTGVQANLGHAIKANNQLAIGDPVRAGRFPNQMGPRIEQILRMENPMEGVDALGPKIGPYTHGLAEGAGIPGASTDRPVHDIWNARAWEYPGKDGKPFDGSPTAAQHRQMDRLQAAAVEQANREGAGGVSDWNYRTSQAAPWRVEQARAGEIDPSEMGSSYSERWQDFYGQGSREALPGKTTNHMQGLLDAPMSVKQEHLDNVYDVMNDPTGRDRIASEFGMPVGPSFKGPGYYEGGVNPGYQTQVAMGRGTGGEWVDPASEGLMDAVEGTYGLLTGQDGIAYHVPGGTKPTLENARALDFNLGRTISDDEMQGVADRMKGVFGDISGQVVPIATPSGARLFLPNPGVNPKEAGFLTLGQRMGQEMGWDAGQRRALIGGNLVETNWRDNPLGQAYLDLLNRPELQNSFDRIAPKLAQQLMDVDRAMSGQGQLGDVGRSELTKLRKVIANEGYQGLMKAIRNGALSIGAVGLMLEGLDTEELTQTQQQPRGLL